MFSSLERNVSEKEEKSDQDADLSIEEILKEQESLLKSGVPYWYREYIRSKRQQRLTQRYTDMCLARSSTENSDAEIAAAEKNISTLPSSFDEYTTKDKDSLKSYENGRNSRCSKKHLCELTVIIEPMPKRKLSNTDLPEFVKTLQRSASYPQIEPTRKIDNINIVLPPIPSPLPYDSKNSTFIISTKDSSEEKNVDASDCVQAEATNDPFDGIDTGSSQGLLSEHFNKSSTLDYSESSCWTISTVKSDIDLHICNLLASSTPLSRSHELNTLVEKHKEKMQNKKWLAKVVTMVHSVPISERRKSQPPPVKVNKDDSQASFFSTSKFANFMKIFKRSPKQAKETKNTSMFFNKKKSPSIQKTRLSLDPQMASKLTAFHSEHNLSQNDK